MAYEATGTVYKVLPTETFDSGFRKRVLVLATDEDGDYPQFVPFEFTQDNTSKLDGVSVGQTATVKFDLRGREWTSKEGVTKFFGSLQAWHVKAEGDAPVGGAPDDEVPF